MTNTVNSKITNNPIPVRFERHVYGVPNGLTPQMIEYDVFDREEKVGFVQLHDTEEGCYVRLMKNVNPGKYGKFGYLADSIGVSHCLENGMENFEVKSYASYNAHALHYLRGLRFIGKASAEKIKRFKEMFNIQEIGQVSYNYIVKYIIEHTPNGENFNTKFLKEIPMYMPKELIKKHIEDLSRHPIAIF